MDYLHKDLTEKIIRAAMEVHKTLRSGFLESVYEEAMAIELDLQKVPFEKQKPADVFYKGKNAKQFFCDFIVEGKVLVELKAIKKTVGNGKCTGIKLPKSDRPAIGIINQFWCPFARI
jgi:GxxExxY protein